MINFIVILLRNAFRDESGTCFRQPDLFCSVGKDHGNFCRAGSYLTKLFEKFPGINRPAGSGYCEDDFSVVIQGMFRIKL